MYIARVSARSTLAAWYVESMHTNNSKRPFLLPFSADCGDASLPLTAPKGLLASPGPDETGVCAWRISVPKNLRIIFNFDSYRIATATSLQDPDCGEKTTRIELKDGPTALPWRVYCQYHIPEPIATANKSSLFVQLKLSQGDSKSYFSAQYSTLPFEQCKCDCEFVLINNY